MSRRAAFGRPRWLELIGRAAIVLLLVTSVIPNLFLLMLSTAPGGASLGWIVAAHPLVSIYALMVLAWQRGAPWAWRLVLVLGLLPWIGFAALMLF